MKTPGSNLDATEELLAYYQGNSAFDFWIGSSVKKSDPHYDEVMGAIAKIFQSSNRIKECVDRHRNGLVGKKPHWYLTDYLGERISNDASIGEKLLQRWQDKQYRLSNSQENTITNPIVEAVTNALVTGRGYLRLWSPKRAHASPDLAARICLHSPHPSAITIARDGDGFINSIIYHYTEDNKSRKEIQFIDESGLTIFATLDESETIIPDSEIALDLGGRYSIYELRSPSLITESVKQAQNAINYALTLMVKSQEYAGFREKLILGGQPPGTWDEDGKFTPDTEFYIGPGKTSFIQGTPLSDDNGNLKGYTNPSVFNSEPVDVKTFIDTAQAYVAVIYNEFSQTHLLSSDLQLSGVSREQARQDFETKLAEHADIVSAAIAGIYGSALMMMVQDEGDIEQYRDLDVAVQLRLNATKPLPQEQEQLLKFQQAGLLSKATAMSLSGFVEDSDSELSLLADEERSRSAVDDASSLLTVGAIDQPQAIELLKRRGRLEADTTLTSGGSKDEVLNGNGTGTTV